jgi:UDPglucose 6-dehydrogenase
LKVAVIGLGYVGLTTALLMDGAGYVVTGCDISDDRVESVIRHEMPFYEPGLDVYMKNHNIICTTSISEAVEYADTILVTVGTPQTENGGINLQYVFEAMKSIAIALDGDESHTKLIMLKSTCIPGTSEKCIDILERYSGLQHGHHFGFVMSPEFLREGSAVEDTLHPDKIVVGFKYDFEFHLAIEFYEFVPHTLDRFIFTNYVNAELIKYANNAFLATKISYINEIANICEYIPGSDVTVVARAIGMDSRIGPKFLNAGLGYGGSCFPKDVSALIQAGNLYGIDSTFLAEVQGVNLAQRDWPLHIIRTRFGEDFENYNLTVAVLGLAFKPDTDDIRDTPAKEIIDMLVRKTEQIRVYDPIVKVWPYSRVTMCESAVEALTDADVAIVVTEWDEFKHFGAETFIMTMATPVVLDGRRIYDPMKMIKSGVEYYGIGYGNINGTY